MLSPSLEIETPPRVQVHDEAALLAENRKVPCILQLSDRGQGSLDVRNLERVAEFRRAILRDRLQSLLTEVRDARSFRCMIGHTAQGSIRFHEGLRRHVGCSHINFRSRNTKPVTGFQTKPGAAWTWWMPDFVGKKFPRKRRPLTLFTRLTSSGARLSCMTSPDLTVSAWTLLPAFS